MLKFYVVKMIPRPGGGGGSSDPILNWFLHDPEDGVPRIRPLRYADGGLIGLWATDDPDGIDPHLIDGDVVTEVPASELELHLGMPGWTRLQKSTTAWVDGEIVTTFEPKTLAEECDAFRALPNVRW